MRIFASRLLVLQFLLPGYWYENLYFQATGVRICFQATGMRIYASRLLV